MRNYLKLFFKPTNPCQWQDIVIFDSVFLPVLLSLFTIKNDNCKDQHNINKEDDRILTWNITTQYPPPIVIVSCLCHCQVHISHFLNFKTQELHGQLICRVSNHMEIEKLNWIKFAFTFALVGVSFLVSRTFPADFLTSSLFFVLLFLVLNISLVSCV